MNKSHFTLTGASRAKQITENLRSRGNDETDPLTDSLLENINATPMGRLLRLIGSLPEIRREKVVTAREKIERGQYDEHHTLDEALDMVLEELITDY